VIRAYLKFYFSITELNDSDSDFIKDFKKNVIDKAHTVNDQEINLIRRNFLKSKQIIEVTDLGAGSKKSKSNYRKVKDIAKHASIPQKYGKLLARIIDYYSLNNCIELGTSLGIGTQYLSLYSKNVVTIEGCSNIYDLAQTHLKNKKNVFQLNGNFDDLLENSLTNCSPPDFIYIDGNHTYTSTLKYFNFYMNHCAEFSVFIIDDIHWSKEMEKAWSEISNSKYSIISIDLFRMGVVIKITKNTKKCYKFKV